MTTTTATRPSRRDVVGYSRLMGVDEEGTHERFKAHLVELIDPKIRGSVAGFRHATLATATRLLHHKREKPLADGNNPPGLGGFPCRFASFFPLGQKWVLALFRCDAGSRRARSRDRRIGTL
jgi:hypothetical protein